MMLIYSPLLVVGLRSANSQILKNGFTTLVVNSGSGNLISKVSCLLIFYTKPKSDATLLT